MNKFKFTGVNLAAALLIIAYFLPWIGIGFGGFSISYSGFEITTGSQGISMVSGFSRFLTILALLVPVSAALILYQNISGNLKFNNFYKLAHIVPAIYLMGGIIILYFKLKPDAPIASESSSKYDEMLEGMKNSMADMTPGIFDILRFGVYLSLIVSVYLLLVSLGKVKDKEYYKPSAVPAENKPPTAE